MAQIHAAVGSSEAPQTIATIEDPALLPKYRVPEVARMLGCTPKTVWRYVGNKTWPHSRRAFGREVWFSDKDVDRIRKEWYGFVAIEPAPAAAQQAG